LLYKDLATSTPVDANLFLQKDTDLLVYTLDPLHADKNNPPQYEKIYTMDLQVNLGFYSLVVTKFTISVIDPCYGSRYQIDKIKIRDYEILDTEQYFFVSKFKSTDGNGEEDKCGLIGYNINLPPATSGIKFAAYGPNNIGFKIWSDEIILTEFKIYSISISAYLINNPIEYSKITDTFNIKVYPCTVIDFKDENRSQEYLFPLKVGFRLIIQYYPFRQNPSKCKYTLRSAINVVGLTNEEAFERPLPHFMSTLNKDN